MKWSILQARSWNGKKITALSLTAFAVVLLISLGSNYYMSVCVQREAAAQQNLTELVTLGQTLADASDYLTDEVRQYAVTGKIVHLRNYWNEIYVDKRRDEVIETLEEFDLPENESALLSEAKRYSDMLVDTETQSMQLVLRETDKTAARFEEDSVLYSYVSYVESYPTELQTDGMTQQELRNMALSMLYDSAYESTKTKIMTPIQQFQTATEERLKLETAQATAGRQTASAIQAGSSVVALLLIGILLWILTRLYILPMTRYASEITEVPGDLPRVRISPCGAYEPRKLGQTFNHMIAQLQHELESRRQAESEMRAARNEADKANEAKSEFLAHMSHELRTPLGAVTGYIYLLERTEMTAAQQRYCRNIRASSEVLLGIINDILDLSKIEAGGIVFEKRDFDLVEMLGDIQHMLENSAREKQLYLQLSLFGDFPAAVHGDQLKLRQILVNLIGNAVKFTEQGGVTLSARMESVTESDCWILFSVSDTGIGVLPEDRQRIFEPFVQGDTGTERRFGGTGLGLVIARQTVEAASGGKETLTLDSEPGKGSTFRFRMKLGVVAQPPQSEPGTAEVRRAEGKTILIVDDNEVNLEMESEILHTFGFESEQAMSGQQALQMARRRVYDMVLLDIRIPDMDGYTIAHRLRQMTAYRLVPLIALTADAVRGVREKALQAGMNDCVVKPLKPPSFYRLLCGYFELAEEIPEALATDENRWFRRDEACETLGGDRRMLLRLCERFLQAQAYSGVYVTTHIQANHFVNARQILHDLIGLSGNLCCDRLCAASRRLLRELHEGAAESLDDFDTAFRETVAEITEFIEENKEQEPRAEQRSFAKTVRRLRGLCVDYDAETADWLQTHAEVLRSGMSDRTFEALERAVQSYDFSGALELLERVQEGNTDVSDSFSGG